MEMTVQVVEQAPRRKKQSMELVAYEEPEPSERVRADLGAHAFEGFCMIEDQESAQSRAIREGLEARVIDQTEAINAIAEAVAREGVRMPGDKRPMASLAFLGPTGVGKSETAKALAEIMGDAGNPRIIKIDCANYSNGHEVTKLVGSPPSYVGHNIEPVFSKKSVEQQGTVILFDEIEKGSPELYQYMLSIMGDGELSLAQGGKVTFENTIVIITSNLGAKQMTDQLSKPPLGFGTNKGPTDRESLSDIATNKFTEFFQPEFINRLNKMIVFHALTNEGLDKVLNMKTARYDSVYRDELGVSLTLSDGARHYLIEKAGEEPHMGARPLVRAFEDSVMTPFGRAVDNEQVTEGTQVRFFSREEAARMGMTVDESKKLVLAVKTDPSIQRKPKPSVAVQFTDAKSEVVQYEASRSDGEDSPSDGEGDEE